MLDHWHVLTPLGQSLHDFKWPILGLNMFSPSLGGTKTVVPRRKQFSFAVPKPQETVVQMRAMIKRNYFG